MVKMIQLPSPVAADIPGLVMTGYIELRPGEWVPLYGSAPKENGQSINTPEGWNMLCERLERARADRLHA